MYMDTITKVELLLQYRCSTSLIYNYVPLIIYLFPIYDNVFRYGSLTADN